MVFILFRAAVPQLPIDWYAGGKKIELGVLAYSATKERKIDLKSTDVVAEIRKRFPEFTPCACLNGTEKPDSFKWLLSGRLGSKGRVYGYVGPKFMETIQTMHHLMQSRYLAYTKPAHTNLGRAMLLLSLIDRGVRSAAGHYLSAVLSNPLRLFKGLHHQSIMIIQPVDFLPNGCRTCVTAARI